MTSFIDPITLLPHRLGEIYSDRHIMIAGSARWMAGTLPTDVGQLQIDPIAGLKLLTTPLDGGSIAVTSIAGGTSIPLSWDNVTQRGSSVWVDLNRLSGSQTVTVGNGITVYDPNTVPKPSESQVLILYRATPTDVIATASFIVAQGPLYTKLGVGTGQRVFAAIVGDDVDSTHTDLQTAINSVASGSWILVKKMCPVVSTINTNGSVIKLMFLGAGTGLIASGATTGIQFDQAGCQLVGFGEINNFTGYGVNLNNKVQSRIEMVFSGNTNNINYGTLNFSQVNIEGSYGLAENTHISNSTTHGTVPRWNNTTKKYESTALTIDDNNKFSGGQNVYAAIVGDNPSIDTHSDLQAAITSVSDGSAILIRKMITTTSGITTAAKSLHLEFGGANTGIKQNTVNGSYAINSQSLVMTSAATYSMRNLAAQSYVPAATTLNAYTLNVFSSSYSSNNTTTVTITNGVSTVGLLAGMSVYFSSATGAQAASINGLRTVVQVLSPSSFTFTAGAAITATTGSVLSCGQMIVTLSGSQTTTGMGMNIGTAVTISSATNALLNGTVSVVSSTSNTFTYWTNAAITAPGSGTLTATVPTTVAITTTSNPSTIGITLAGQKIDIYSATATALNGFQTVSYVAPTSIFFTVASSFVSGTLTVAEPIVNVTTTIPLNLIGDGITSLASITSATDTNLNGNIAITTTGSSTFGIPVTFAPTMTGVMTVGYIQTTATYSYSSNTITITPAIGTSSFGSMVGGTNGLEIGGSILITNSSSTAMNGYWRIANVSPTTFTVTTLSAITPATGACGLAADFANITVTASNSLVNGSSVSIITASDTKLVGTKKVMGANSSQFSFRPYAAATSYTAGTLTSGINNLTGLQLQGNNCKVKGFGQITGFTTGIDLNGKTGTRVEMVFSGNTTNIGYGSLASDAVQVEGSYGLVETSVIEISTSDGAMARWNTTKKRWEPVPNLTTTSGGTLVTTSSMAAANMNITGTLTAGIVIGAVYN